MQVSIKSTKLLSVILITFLFLKNTSAQAPADPSSIIGKVVCGYQGWFTCTSDGSPINRWTHWSISTAPQPGVAPNPNPNLTFDAYPDVSLYEPSSLFKTNFANLGDGKKAKLFSSYKQDVTDKHFELLQANGIDGVAFQRFIWEVLVDPAFKANRDTVAVHVRKSAEKYQRLFYLVYDLSGLGNVPAANDQARFDGIKNDWTNNMLANLHLTSSSMYAKQGGKPVVQIWGIGYNHIIGTAAIQLDLINWFKAQGCYVIIGTPTGWRTGTGASNAGWINTYKAGNMISPWSVGGYSDQASTDNFKTSFLSPDLTWCNTNGIAYQPVIFPGFSWYNWNSGTKNQISRNKGEFLWRQATNLRSLGITSAEIAMLDEFDEGTAILPMADGYNMIPTNQYFVTTSADGTYLSSDFYLRLANKVSKVIKGSEASTTNVAIPYSLGPMYFRTSLEAGSDPTPTWTSITDAKSNVTKYGSNTSSTTPTCATSTEKAKLGLSSIKIMGRDRSTSTSYAYFRVFDVDIPITTTTDLSFWTYPLNDLGKYISVDLLMTDGSTLRDAGAIDQGGFSMHPGTGRGTLNTWTQTVCNIGNWLNGKTIDRILIGYDHALETGDFSGYIDDIQINEQSTYIILPVKINSFSAAAEKNDVIIKWQTSGEQNIQQYEIERSLDGKNFEPINRIIPTKGLSTKNYSELDYGVINKTHPLARQLYYRLKTVGTEGEISYSKIALVSPGIKSSFSVNVFPNPFINKIDLSVNALQDDVMKVVITDVSGKTILNNKMNVSKGFTKITLSHLENYPRGIYILKIFFGDETRTFKIKK